MRFLRLVTVLPLALLGCASTSSSTSTSSASAPASPSSTTATEQPASHVEKWQSRAEDPACQQRLGLLARGELTQFEGVVKCGRVDAEKVLGDSGKAPSKFEQFGEYRVYKHGKDTLLVWFLADDIRVIQLLYPKLGAPLPTLLGAPQTKIKSQLSPEWEQWVYANRGLTLHVKKTSGEPVVLFAYAPSTVEEFLKSDVARVARTETPVEELK
jgi:hypothetical protein